MKKLICIMLLITISLCLVSCIEFVENETGVSEVITSENTEKNDESQSDTISPSSNNESVAFEAPADELGLIEEIDTQISNTLVSVGYTIEHATAIHEILNTIGIESISIENMTGEAESGLNAVVCFPNGETDDDRRFHFTTENGILFYAGFLNEDLYDTMQGGFLKSYADVDIPEKEVTIDTFNMLQSIAIEEVKLCLNFPDSANFSMLDWAVGRNNNQYMITGKVSAENAFKIADDIFFSVWLIDNNGAFELEGIELNGTRVK